MTQKLRVWWIPQVGAGLVPFYQEVQNVQQGHELLKSLARYDLYQYENNVKPDYSNGGGLEVMGVDGDWVDWCDSNGNELRRLEIDSNNYDLSSYFGRYGVNGLQFDNKLDERLLIQQDECYAVAVVPSKISNSVILEQFYSDDEMHSVKLKKDGAKKLIDELTKFICEP